MKYSLNKISRDDVLGAIGLQTRRTAAEMVLPTLGLLGVGIVVGAGLGLLFAPKAGAQTRAAIGHGVGEVARRVTARIRRNRDELPDLDLDDLPEVDEVIHAARNGAASRAAHSGTMPTAPKA